MFSLKRHMNINFKGGYFNFNFLTKSDWSMDIVQSAWTPWTLSRVSMDNVQTTLRPWTMSTESMDKVHWIHGHCPVWLVSLDFVHGLTGLCPEYPWTLSRLSTESMVNVYWVHGLSTDGYNALSTIIYFKQSSENGLVKNTVSFSQNIFSASNFFMYISNIQYVCNISAKYWKDPVKALREVDCTKYALSTIIYLMQSSENG